LRLRFLLAFDSNLRLECSNGAIQPFCHIRLLSAIGNLIFFLWLGLAMDTYAIGLLAQFNLADFADPLLMGCYLRSRFATHYGIIVFDTLLEGLILSSICHWIPH